MKAQLKPVIVDYFPIEQSTFYANGLLQLIAWVESFGDKFEYRFIIDLHPKDLGANISEIKFIHSPNRNILRLSESHVIVRAANGDYSILNKTTFSLNYDTIKP